ncbi:MAG: hydrogenase formation protein HypD [Cytophagales bacterium]
MKYLSEYRNSEIVKDLLGKIEIELKGQWNIMEICGGQTHSLVKNGILEMLPEGITMIHGPGCPVCVTPVEMIDKAIELSLIKGITICSFGDMLRVPGSEMSLLKAKAMGADIRIVYSPLEAVNLARSNPQLEIVFFAVGFETTAPPNGLSVIMAKKLGLFNYSLLVSHVLVPPAMEAILSDEENKIDGFLAAGHVCTVMGYQDYYPIAEKYKIPIIVTGFEPIDLLNGILACVKQLENGRYDIQNEYSRVVDKSGNPQALKVVNEVFEIADRKWRGIGTIPKSGYELNEKHKKFDANLKYELKAKSVEESLACIAGMVLKGLKKPHQCPEFGKSCTPMNPLGAPMVSSEGACAAYYQFSQYHEAIS